MERRTPVSSLLLLTFLLMVGPFILSCDGSSQEIQFTGTIQYVDLEGGFYAIRSDDNVYYDPANLESGYQVQDLRVQVTAVLREDIASTRMFGQVIDIVTITVLER